MQIAKREQRKISLISVIAKKAGGEANSFNQRRGKGSLKEMVTRISRLESSDLSRFQDLAEV